MKCLKLFCGFLVLGSAYGATTNSYYDRDSLSENILKSCSSFEVADSGKMTLRCNTHYKGRFLRDIKKVVYLNDHITAVQDDYGRWDELGWNDNVGETLLDVCRLPSRQADRFDLSQDDLLLGVICEYTDPDDGKTIGWLHLALEMYIKNDTTGLGLRLEN